MEKMNSMVLSSVFRLFTGFVSLDYSIYLFQRNFFFFFFFVHQMKVVMNAVGVLPRFPLLSQHIHPKPLSTNDSQLPPF